MAPQTTRSRTTRSVYTYAAAVFFTASTSLLGFFVTPALVRWLGRDVFGISRVLVDCYQYIGLLEIGMSGPVIASLTRIVADPSAGSVDAVVAAGWRTQLWITVGMLFLWLLVVGVVPEFLATPGTPPGTVRLAAAILFIPVLLTPISVFRVLAEVKQAGYLVNLVTTAQSVFNTGALALFAYAGFGLLGQASVFALASFFVLPVYLTYAARHAPGWRSARPDAHALRTMVGLRWPTFGCLVSERLGLFSDNILVAAIVSPSLVSPFYLTQRLVNMAQTYLLHVGGSTWAGISELHFQGQHDAVRDRLVELTASITALSVAASAPIIAFNPFFIARWVGPSMFAGDAITVVACLNLWLWSLSYLWSRPVNSTGYVRKLLPYAAAFVILNLTVSVVAAKLLGVVGPPIGSLTAFIGVNCWGIPRVLREVFHVDPIDLWRSALRPLAAGVPYIAATVVGARYAAPANWPELLAEMLIAGIGGLLLWLALMSPSRRGIWWTRLRGALPEGVIGARSASARPR